MRKAAASAAARTLYHLRPDKVSDTTGSTLAAGLHGVIDVFFLSSSINGLCHVRGYRTFDNTATNIPWLALITGGEGFHNNHHGFPRSPKFSVRSGEIDPSWPIIQLLTRLKLARPHHAIEQSSEDRDARRRVGVPDG